MKQNLIKDKPSETCSINISIKKKEKYKNKEFISICKKNKNL
jgi:hypothetical protein